MPFKIPKIFKNFFILLGIFFLFWMIFIDSNDLFSQFQLRKKVKNLEAERKYYENKIEEVKQEREELMSNQELLEKFAREKYLMKKPSEDLFIIETEN